MDVRGARIFTKTMSKSSQVKQGGTKSASSKNKDDMAQLKEEIKQLKSERKDQTSTITDLKKRVKKLESDLTKAKHGLESTAPEFLDMISGVSRESYEKKMIQLEEENQRLRSRHNGEENGNEEEIAKMRKNIQKLTSDRDKFEMEKNELVKRNQEILKQLNNKPKRNQSTVSTQGTDNEQDKREKLKGELEKLERENKDLIEENNTLKKNQTQEKENTTDKNLVDFEKVNKENKALNERVKNLDEEISRVKDDNERLNAKQADSNNKDMAKLQEEKTSLEKNINKQENEISKLKEENGVLEKEIKDIQSKMKKMEDEAGRLIAQNTESNSKDMSTLQEEKASLEKEIKKHESKILNLKEEKEDLKREIREQKKENKKGDSSSAEKISRLEEEVEGLRNRLSKIAGAQLTDNNPAIADLSDPNRPLSLGEKFSELYDNEWTDAMEELSDSSDERAVIKQLLKIVVESYQFCCEQSDKFMDRINGTMEMFSDNLVSEMPKEISKTNKDFRKSLAVHCVYHLQEEFTNKNSIGNIRKKTKDYMKKCVQICWFMTVQDPKVVINYKVTGQFDEDRFKAYTKKGKQVDYLVWPALHLHEGGPMISKGVAQGK